ncbi:phage protein NinX family protein [Enterobacter asburiae]|uniref:phage protein NinX family protein n=1 Tax=Enterobacter asburiae TaxID=61645 RepID=UPI0034CE7031
MDYSQLSDFEINAMVHFGKEPQFKIENGYASFLNGDGAKTGFGQFYYKNNFPDYCNNAADAWPIIESNRISIRNRYEGDWKAENEWGESRFHVACNPLRAAMIVFLMMQDSKHA